MDPIRISLRDNSIVQRKEYAIEAYPFHSSIQQGYTIATKYTFIKVPEILGAGGFYFHALQQAQLICEFMCSCTTMELGKYFFSEIESTYSLDSMIGVPAVNRLLA